MAMDDDVVGAVPDTAVALIEAGRRLFARHGYDGASVRAITTAAGANLGAITYHFGSKRAFYDRVVETSVGGIADRVEAAVAGPGPVFDRVDRVVRAIFDFLFDHPEVPHLLLQELAVGRPPPKSAAKPVLRMHTALTGLIREGQEAGLVRAGDPRIMGISLASQPLHLSLIRRPLDEFAGLDLGDPEVRERIISNAVAFACGGIAARPVDE